MKRIPFWLAFLLALLATTGNGVVALDIVPATPPIAGKLVLLGVMLVLWANTVLGNPFKSETPVVGSMLK